MHRSHTHNTKSERRSGQTKDLGSTSQAPRPVCSWQWSLVTCTSLQCLFTCILLPSYNLLRFVGLFNFGSNLFLLSAGNVLWSRSSGELNAQIEQILVYFGFPPCYQEPVCLRFILKETIPSFSVDYSFSFFSFYLQVDPQIIIFYLFEFLLVSCVFALVV